MSREMKKRLERFIKTHGIPFWQVYLVLYKVVTKRFESPFAAEPLRFDPYTDVVVPQANRDPRWDCGAGIHVCTQECALAHVHAGNADRIMRVLVRPSDVACVADDTLAARRCEVLRHKLRVQAVFVVDDVLRRKDGVVYLRERPLDTLVDFS